MTKEPFLLGDLKLNPGSVRRDSFLGVHSGRSLSKFEASIATATPEQTASVEQLLEKKRVQCFDPEQQRSFEVDLILQTSSYQSSRPEKRFSISASEIDAWPEFEALEIEGVRFTVSQYRETNDGHGQVGRHAVLNLNDDELRRLRELVKPGRVGVSRVGVDGQPLSLRFGGMQCWSEETANGQKEIKQIVRFYSADPDEKSPVFASAVIQDNTALLAIEAAHKLNALVDELRRSGVLPEERASAYRVVVKATNLEKTVVDEWRWRLDKVRDASDYL